jgi:hypothetical protein
MAIQAPTNAPTPYAAPYMNMEQRVQPQNTPTEREYQYTRGDVVYRGAEARKREMAQGLYDSGEYDYADAVKLSERLYDAQQREKKLKVQETFLAIGDHESKLRQQEVENNKLANRQKIGTAISALDTYNLSSFPDQVQNLRDQYAEQIATDPELSNLLASKIKEQESHFKIMQDVAVASGARTLDPRMLNANGHINAKSVSAIGKQQKLEDANQSERIKSSYKQQEDLRKRAFEEIASKRESGGRMARQRAQEQVAATGGKATYKEGGATVTLEPSSAMSAKGFRQMAEKENQAAIKAGKTPPNKIQEPVEFNPNDRKAAMLYAQEKAQQYGLTNNPDDRQTLIELVRAEGYNF